QVHVERATRRAEPAHHRRGGIGLEPRRHLAQPEAARLTGELGGERTVLLALGLLAWLLAQELHRLGGSYGLVKNAMRRRSSNHTTAASMAVRAAVRSGCDRQSATVEAHHTVATPVTAAVRTNEAVTRRGRHRARPVTT